MSRRRSNPAGHPLATPGKSCCFCGLSDDNEIEYGKLYELGTIVTHYYCLVSIIFHILVKINNKSNKITNI